MEALPAPSKPDLDNLAKAVLDVLTQLGVWRDDAQVVSGSWEKLYHAVGGRSGCHVVVEEVEP